MKKSILLLFFVGLFFGCSKDADDSDQQFQEFTVTLNIDPNHSFGTFAESARAFLSDQDGEIVASEDLQPGQTTTLTTNADPTSIFDLTYVIYKYYGVVNEKVYSIETFSNVQQGTYNLGPKKIMEDTNDEIYIHLSNTGYPCEAVATSAGYGTFGPENGGYLNWQANLVGSPTSDYYAAFKSPNDQFNRYVWLEDVAEGSSFNIDYTTLPEIQNLVTTAVPANDYAYFQLFGLVENDANKISHSIGYDNFSNGIASFTNAVPQNVFDQYLLELTYRDGSTTNFNQLRTSAIPTQVTIPPLDLTVNNPSPQSFNMNLVGDGILYNVSFVNENASGSIFVGHFIYGAVAPEVSFSKENLRLNVQAEYPDLSQFETVTLRDATVTRYSALNTYNDILTYQIERKRFVVPDLNGFFEGIIKDF